MGNSYAYIILANPTTTVVSEGPCILSGITVNKAVANGVITIYDGANIIGIHTAPAVLLQNHYSISYFDICIKKGLTIITSGAAQNLTVAYHPA